MASLELLECAGCGLLKVRQDQKHRLRQDDAQQERLTTDRPDPHDPVFLNTTLPTRCFSTPPIPMRFTYQAGSQHGCQPMHTLLGCEGL